MMEKELSREKLLPERMREIQEKVARAAKESGRNPQEIRIVVVTKTHTADLVNLAIANGAEILGENRAQELCQRYDSYHKELVDIHFIGHLQTNKVRSIIDKVSMIQSVDSLRLGEEISRQAQKRNKVMDILVEVNIAKEPTKSGVVPEELEPLLLQLSHLEGIRVRGLITIPPKWDKNMENPGYFRKMYQLFIDIKTKKLDNICMDFLSMGMSGDYEEAIRCGSNMIRLGSAVFGQRLI